MNRTITNAIGSGFIRPTVNSLGPQAVALDHRLQLVSVFLPASNTLPQHHTTIPSYRSMVRGVCQNGSKEDTN